MASEAHSADRRRLLNLIAVVGAALVAGVGSLLASVAYASSTAHGQNAIIAQLRQQQLAACNAAADLGTVPLPAKPPPSRFTVKIVTDNRAQWYGLGCGRPGSLPVPPGLAAAAARWKIPVNGKAP